MSSAETYRQIMAWVGAIEIPICTAIFTLFAMDKLILRVTPWNRRLFLRITTSYATRKIHEQISLTAMRATVDLSFFCGITGISHQVLKSHLLRSREIRLAIHWAAYFAATGAIALGGLAARFAAMSYPKVPEWAPASSYLLSIPLCIYMTYKLHARWIREAYFITAPEHLASAITMCVDAYQRTISPLILNQQIDRLRLALAQAVNVGYPGLSLERSDELRAHVRDVIHTIHIAMGEFLAKGSAELRPLAAILGTILQRVISGQWQGLLNEDQIIEYDEEMPEPQSRLRAWRDPILMLAGVILLGAASIGAESVGFGADVMSIIAGAILLLPLALWGSRRAGLSPESLYMAVRSNAGLPETPSSARQDQEPTGQTPSNTQR
ncbi:hypothetical protein [Streptomyces sp. NPDC050428]|uniref:hypothetical protein n=1 Tax=Streptomyces sp. NPDC050428 TaxID=3155757 RepID=UPI003434D52B